MEKKRVVHYITQFYAGMGGEDTGRAALLPSRDQRPAGSHRLTP